MREGKETSNYDYFVNQFMLGKSNKLAAPAEPALYILTPAMLAQLQTACSPCSK